MRNPKGLWRTVRGLLPDRNAWLESALRCGLCGLGRQHPIRDRRFHCGLVRGRRRTVALSRAPTVSPGPGPTRTPELVCSYTRTGNVGRAPTDGEGGTGGRQSERETSGERADRAGTPWVPGDVADAHAAAGDAVAAGDVPGGRASAFPQGRRAGRRHAAHERVVHDRPVPGPVRGRRADRGGGSADGQRRRQAVGGRRRDRPLSGRRSPSGRPRGGCRGRRRGPVRLDVGGRRSALPGAVGRGGGLPGAAAAKAAAGEGVAG